MPAPNGRLQFFALEATDYLDRLALIAGRSDPPDGEDFVRLSRALRGAALMAGLAGYARAAAALEQVAKTHRDPSTPWTTDRAGIVGAAVQTLKRLTARAADWSDADESEAAAVAKSLATLAGAEAPTRQAAPEGDDLKPSVRDFIGREGAAIAGTLEHAAQALEAGQPAEATDVVLARLQPLRGLASLPKLSPLPEFLDAIELTIRSIQNSAPPPGGAGALRHAASAVSRLAREIADRGEATTDTPELTLGALSLLAAFGTEEDVVPVESLFKAGDQTPVVRMGEYAPTRDSLHDPTIELVSLSDRLRQAADQSGSPTTATGRTLYLYSLVVQLRPMTQQAPRDYPQLGDLLEAVSEAVGGGRAVRAPTEFAGALREAADLVAAAAQARNAIFLADELAPVVERLERLGVAVPAAAEPADDLGPIVPIESLFPDPAPLPVMEPEPVPIETLAPTTDDALEPEPPTVPVAASSPPLSAFERSFTTYHRLVTSPPPAAAAPEAEAVPIAELLYRGRRALERADAVRIDLSEALRRQRPFTEIEPMVSELIDLVPLALTE